VTNQTNSERPVSREHYAAFVARFKGGDWPSQRFGQAFVNFFCLDCCAAKKAAGYSGACLFHERNEGRAKEIIRDLFLETSW